MLVLFDIDGTLLLSQRAGANSMIDAGRRVVGPHFTFDGVEIAGRLDPLIWNDAAVASGVDDPAARHEEFRALYRELLEERLAEHPTVTALPGVHALVDRLETVDGVVLGVLTGNYRETGMLKLAAAGLAPDRFPVAAWGSDGGHRRELPPVAMRRFSERQGHPIAPERVVIIGDTPHDVDCAHFNGCRALGVATGPSFSRQDLIAHEPDLAVDDLADTDAIVDWMLKVTALDIA